MAFTEETARVYIRKHVVEAHPEVMRTALKFSDLVSFAYALSRARVLIADGEWAVNKMAGKMYLLENKTSVACVSLFWALPQMFASEEPDIVEIRAGDTPMSVAVDRLSLQLLNASALQFKSLGFGPLGLHAVLLAQPGRLAEVEAEAQRASKAFVAAHEEQLRAEAWKGANDLLFAHTVKMLALKSAEVEKFVQSNAGNYLKLACEGSSVVA